MSASPQASANPVFTISRVFNAPRATVWQAHTEAERLKQWFGPKGFTMSHCTLDLRPGGMFHYRLQAPDGQEVWGRWIFREIVAPERIVLVMSFSDAAGGITRHPWSAEWPLQTFSTTTFTDTGDGRTRLDISWTPHEAGTSERQAFADGMASMTEGWSGTLERLEGYLPR